MARIQVYADADFNGDDSTFDRTIPDIGTFLNDKITSARVYEGRWELWEHPDFHGRMVVLEPGEYPNIAIYPGGLSNDTISSVRIV
ncbi:beta/gamma crystallin family protein [Rivularia sp. UHCC 0363]|uniref:beta/gamma crystallin family protein n=1 Tax=Rivularia sp. UHCC 0363 TaxID=3110244 RepID=UPI002B2210AC|nr:beta/gamma crystallin family protein [Rivularia sp. UHCC 0363]MEA5599333.1 beta/gamma crystallin family protein [Rivularia sp. UHCC 0363]